MSLLLLLLLTTLAAATPYPHVHDPFLTNSPPTKVHLPTFHKSLADALRVDSNQSLSAMTNLTSAMHSHTSPVCKPIDFFVASNSSRIAHAFLIGLDQNCPYPGVLHNMDNILFSLGLSIVHTYKEAIQAYRVRYTPSPEHPTLPKKFFECIPCLTWIEEEHSMSHTQVEVGATWGLSRIGTLQGRSAYDSLYAFDLTGLGVHIYVIDSGIISSHPEFTGRAELAFTVSSISSQIRADSDDCTGHGTHVAGITGGVNTGVAKQANIHAVRVIGCSKTTNSDLIEAIEWVILNHRSPAVVNISLGPEVEPGTTSYLRATGLDTAVNKAVSSGITVVVAAGNDNLDCCSGSPAAAENAIAVAATTFDNGVDSRASFSNFGPCVKFFAPGEDIVSSSLDKNNGYANLKGTSQAAPHVTGAVALVYQQNPNYTPAQVLSKLQAAAIYNVISDIITSPNVLLRSITNGNATGGPNLVTFTKTGLDAIKNLQKTHLSSTISITIIAIATGAALLYIIIIICVCVYYRKRRRNARVTEEEKVKQGLPTEEKEQVPQPSEQPSAQQEELPPWSLFRQPQQAYLAPPEPHMFTSHSAPTTPTTNISPVHYDELNNLQNSYVMFLSHSDSGIVTKEASYQPFL